MASTSTSKIGSAPKLNVAQRRGLVVQFLKQNPLSTSAEIHTATGQWIGSVMRAGMFKRVMYGTPPKPCWRVLPNPEQRIGGNDAPSRGKACGVCGQPIAHDATDCAACGSSDFDGAT